MPEPQQHGIQAESSNYTTAHGNTGSLTHWARPGIKPTTSWFLVRFVNHWATMGTPFLCFLYYYFFNVIPTFIFSSLLLPIYIYIIIIIIIILPFLGPLSQHMEVPRLGVESELEPLAYATATATQDPSHICDLHHSSWQCQIVNPLSKARDLEPATSWFLVRFASTVP